MLEKNIMVNGFVYSVEIAIKNSEEWETSSIKNEEGKEVEDDEIVVDVWGEIGKNYKEWYFEEMQDVQDAEAERRIDEARDALIDLTAYATQRGGKQ